MSGDPGFYTRVRGNDMGDSTPTTPPDDVIEGWESERDSERAKVTARWFAIVVLLGAMFWIRKHDPVVAAHVSSLTAWELALAGTVMTAAEAIYLWKPGRVQIPRWLKYVTVLGDMVFISVLVSLTGYTRSPFFFVYFVFLISNCLRYGLLMSLFVAAAFNVLYVFVLGFAPESERQASVLGGEGLKIVAFWAVALYGGAISARIRRQGNQLRVYEETIREQRAQISDLRNSSVSTEENPS
jgi:hypothetical protein